MRSLRAHLFARAILADAIAPTTSPHKRPEFVGRSRATAAPRLCKKERPAIVKANPNATFGEVGKLLGAAWGKLSDASKAKYK